MAVVQQNKEKVRPALDFRELNTFIEAFTANTDACADKLRDWRRFAENVSIIDLSSAYMKLKIDEKLWAYQTVAFRGQKILFNTFGIRTKLCASHNESGHYGVKKTLYFVCKIDPSVSKEEVKQVVEKCIACQSIDTSPTKLPKREIEVKRKWQGLGMDITYYEGQHYLTLIDCGPIRYAIWRYLIDQTSTCVIQELNAIFLEQGGLDEILTDNDTALRSTLFSQFVTKWNFKLQFRCAYAPSGNGIAERCHRTFKRTAKRVPCSILKVVYWYNVSPEAGCKSSTTSANKLYQYEIKVREINNNKYAHDSYKKITNKFKLGDKVWVKPSDNRCDSQYKIGIVTEIISEQTVEVDKMCRHVRDLRKVRADNDSNKDLGQVSDDNDLNEDPEDEEELYVALPEEKTNKTQSVTKKYAGKEDS
ncbi:uncharacterized protein LOC136076148 [Hydra vulgaris]|uniref:Uncharacterized protein LOC136076148 n=1 Tax=Hydra vulgaris TaxID=6087 RepID=A0ABM4B9W6_HYDVU